MVTEEKLLSEQDAFPVEVFVRKNREDPMLSNPHWHNCFEILYVLNGKAEYRTSKTASEITADDFILIRCGEIHTIVCPEKEETDILVIKFLPSVIYSPYYQISGLNYISAFLNSENIYHLEENEQREIRKILTGICHEYTEKRRAYELLVRSGVYQLIAACIRYRMIVLPDRFIAAEYHTLLPVLQYIEQNYASEITLKKIAEMMHLNYAYTSRYFKRVVGRSFKQYLDYIRVNEAERMLLQGKEYAYIIAQKCGFSNQQTFIRTFKRLRGYTPKVKKCSFLNK